MAVGGKGVWGVERSYGKLENKRRNGKIRIGVRGMRGGLYVTASRKL